MLPGMRTLEQNLLMRISQSHILPDTRNDHQLLNQESMTMMAALSLSTLSTTKQRNSPTLPFLRRSLLEKLLNIFLITISALSATTVSSQTNFGENYYPLYSPSVIRTIKKQKKNLPILVPGGDGNLNCLPNLIHSSALFALFLLNSSQLCS